MNKKNNELIFKMVMALVFFIMLVLNRLTPMIADDYNYCYSFNSGARISGITDIVMSMRGHYEILNGRIFAHSIVQFILMYDLLIFDILNAIMFVLLGYLVYRFVVLDKCKQVTLLVIIYGTLFIKIPTFGQTVLWLDGSINYMWTMIVMLLFVLPYRYYAESEKRHSWYFSLLMCIAGFFAGSCNENTSPATLLGASILMGYMLYRKVKLKLWMFLGLIFGVIGFIWMITAPANQVRGDTSFSWLQIKDRVVNITQFIRAQTGTLFVVILCLFVLAYIYQMRKEKIFIAGIMLIMSLASAYAMIFSPSFPTRAFMGTQIYMIIAGVIVFDELNIEWVSVAKKLVVTYMLCLLIFQFILAFDSIMTTYLWFLERKEYIELEKEQGNTDIETFYIYSNNPYSVFYNLIDLIDDSSYWTNESFAKYYEINSITAREGKGR